MNRLPSVSLTLTLTSLVLGGITPFAKAQTPISFAFTGEIVNVTDQYHWLGDTYVVGSHITGTMTYFDSGYTPGVYSGYPETKDYNYGSRHIVHPDFSLTAGERQVNQQGNSFRVTVTNNGPAPFDNEGGDTVAIQPSFYTLPGFFNDPANTPGFEDYYAFPFVGLKFYDPTGTALASADLPLTFPDLSAFSTSIGQIGISDGNGDFSEFARAQFRITSITAVPEPGSLALLLGIGVSGVGLLMRRRR